MSFLFEHEELFQCGLLTHMTPHDAHCYCNMKLRIYYLAPGGGCEVLFSPGLSVCLCVCVSVCLSVCVSGQYFGILFLSY